MAEVTRTNGRAGEGRRRGMRHPRALDPLLPAPTPSAAQPTTNKNTNARPPSRANPLPPPHPLRCPHYIVVRVACSAGPAMARLTISMLRPRVSHGRFTASGGARTDCFGELGAAAGAHGRGQARRQHGQHGPWEERAGTPGRATPAAGGAV